MMDIRFYDFDFNRLGDFARPISVNIEKKYCGYGVAELHFAINEVNLISLLKNNEYLFCIADGNAAIVTGWQLDEDIAIYGRTPEWLLTKRGVEPFSFADTNAEAMARCVVEGVPDFVALGGLSNVGTSASYSTEDVRSLYDVVCEVLKPQALGFEVFPDISEKKFVFRVYEGKESLCMFSASNRSAYNVKYSVEKQDSADSGWYKRRYKDMGDWDANTNSPGLSNNQPSNAYTFYKITSSGTISRFGLSCTQGLYLCCDNVQGVWKISASRPDSIWIYIGNSLKSGLKKWDTVLSGVKTEEEAKAALKKTAVSAKTDCETYRVEYGKDYGLGDLVRVQVEFGEFKFAEVKRVASVNIYYDVDKSGVTPQLDSLEE